MNPIQFEGIKEQIVEALKKKGNLGITEPVTLIDGFFNHPFHKEISNSMVIGGPAIPMVMLLGNNTGRVYFFALRAILPNLKF